MWTAFPVMGRPEASSANSGPKSPPPEPPENPPLRALLDPIRPQDTCKTQLKADRDVNNRNLENAHGASAGATFLALTRGQNSANNISRATRRAMWTAFPVLGRPEASSANRGPKSPPQEPPENPPVGPLLDPIRPQNTCKTQRDVDNRFWKMCTPPQREPHFWL